MILDKNKLNSDDHKVEEIIKIIDNGTYKECCDWVKREKGNLKTGSKDLQEAIKMVEGLINDIQTVCKENDIKDVKAIEALWRMSIDEDDEGDEE